MSTIILVLYRLGYYEERLPEAPTASLPVGYMGERYSVPEGARDALRPLGHRSPGEPFAIPNTSLVDLRGPAPMVKTHAAAAWDEWPVGEIRTPLTAAEMGRYPLAPADVDRFVRHRHADVVRVTGSRVEADRAARAARAAAAGRLGLRALLGVHEWVARAPSRLRADGTIVLPGDVCKALGDGVSLVRSPEGFRVIAAASPGEGGQ